MPVTSTPAFAQAIAVGVAKIVTADTTTLKTILTAGANGTLIDSILVSSDDSSTRDFQLWTTLSAVDYLLATVSIPANSGFSGSVSLVSLLDNARFGTSTAPSGLQITDPNGNKLLRLKAGEILKAKVLVSVTAAKTVYVRASGADL